MYYFLFNGQYLDGCVIENSHITKRLVMAANNDNDESAGAMRTGEGTDPCEGIQCEQQLEEVVITSNPSPEPSNRVIYWVILGNDDEPHFAEPQDDGPGNGHTSGGRGGTNGNQNNSDNDDTECGEGYMQNEEGDCVLIDDNLQNDLTDQCAYLIFYQLEEGIYTNDVLHPEIRIPVTSLDPNIELNFSESILALFNSTSSFDYIIQNGSTSNPSANAETIGLVTTLNDNYLTSATQLAIARTIIHEIVHAYLNALYANPFEFNSLSLRQKMDIYAQNNGYTVGSNDFHHNFMGQYINGMAYALYQWDSDYGTGGGLGWDYYYSMAFAGQFATDVAGNIVSTTDVFLQLVPNPSDRQNIVNIILNENNANNQAQGSECN